MFNRKRNKFSSNKITPDEIFLDSENLSNLDSEQFEGRMEKPIGYKSFLFLGAVFFLFGSALLCRVGYLQIIKGGLFFERSLNNHLRSVTLLPERGLIYDRNNEALAWNSPAFYLAFKKEAFLDDNIKPNLEKLLESIGKTNAQSIIQKGISSGEDIPVAVFYDWDEINDIYRQWSYLPIKIEASSLRSYKKVEGIAHLVGYAGQAPTGFYDGIVGKAGMEKSYEDILSGESGTKLIEVNSLGKIKSENIQSFPVHGSDLVLSADYRIQEKLYEIFEDLSESKGFQGGAGVILDVNNGQILAMSSYPEYNPQVLSRGEPEEQINEYIQDSKKPFLNRAVSGLYTPGSVIKPFMALAALIENIISPEKSIYSSGSISIPNPYNPELKSVFRDWKAHGWVDMRHALAVSSDVYFYSIGGGYEDINGLGIKKIEEYMRFFGFGEKTGINLEGEADGTIPSPEFKKEVEEGEIWRIGDTYNTSIGQGYFQVTPIQMASLVAMIASEGSLFKPTFLLNEKGEEIKKFDISDDYFKIVKEGMRLGVLEGTSQALSGLPVEMAAKTGTAELGLSKKFVNSWIVAFWPYEKPRFAASVVLEKGSVNNLVGGVYAMYQLMSWMAENTPEYLQ